MPERASPGPPLPIGTGRLKRCPCRLAFIKAGIDGSAYGLTRVNSRSDLRSNLSDGADRGQRYSRNKVDRRCCLLTVRNDSGL